MVWGLNGSRNWNEYNLNPLMRINWRASLVPAAAVIPVQIVYIKVVAAKKLVVGFWNGPVGLLQGDLLAGLIFFTKTACAFYCVCIRFTTLTFKKLQCSKRTIA